MIAKASSVKQHHTEHIYICGVKAARAHVAAAPQAAKHAPAGPWVFSSYFFPKIHPLGRKYHTALQY
jgi:hypothetical protein